MGSYFGWRSLVSSPGSYVAGDIIGDITDQTESETVEPCAHHVLSVICLAWQTEERTADYFIVLAGTDRLRE